MSDSESNDLWLKTRVIPALREGDLQVWRLDLEGEEGSGLLTQAFRALTTDERRRAARMRTGTAPEEFIAGRGLLRHLLGAFLDCDPRGVEFVMGSHRKPALRPLRGMRLPHFNVSHSRGMVLIALSRLGPVGVDVEYMHAAVEALNVARAAFHPDDLRTIESAATGKERLLAFYGCWTRREAVAKADGRGLTLPASGFSTGAYCTAAEMVEVGGDGGFRSPDGSTARYFVQNLDVGPCHLGGVAVARSCKKPLLLEFSCAPTASGGESSVSVHVSPHTAT